jgi:hypothetical protein
MEKLNAVIRDKILDNLKSYSFMCSGCLKIHECEEKVSEYGYEARYCESLIVAAIMDKQKFQIPFL